jgi:hypothetical protein
MTMETKEKEGKLFFQRITLKLDFNKTENQPRNVASRRRPNTAP